jgi:hypothetical protein
MALNILREAAGLGPWPDGDAPSEDLKNGQSITAELEADGGEGQSGAGDADSAAGRPR